jgi:hypothetical protein
MRIARLIADRSNADPPVAARARGAPEPDIVETRRIIALFNAAHIAMAIMGDALLPAADLVADETGQDDFLKWVTQLLGERLEPD